MGKHGPYVWFCYGITALVLLGLLWQARAERRRFFREQQAQLRRDARKTSSATGDRDDASQA